MKKRIRIQGMLIFFAVVIAILFYEFVFPRWEDEEIDEFLDCIGIALLLLGFLFRISARGHKEESSLSGNKLTTDGPYALVRNPMYFGTLMLGTGFVTTLVEWWALPVFLGIFLFIYIPQIKKEEASLATRFGQEYKDYCKITPRYFPRGDYLLSPRKYLPLKFPWIKKELPSFIFAIVCIITVEIWKDVRLFGRKELFEETAELMLTAGALIFLILLVFRVKETQRSKN